MQINLQQLIIPSGHQVLLKDVDWQAFENIMDELGDERNIPRISYSKGYLEFMSPLAIRVVVLNFVGANLFA